MMLYPSMQVRQPFEVAVIGGGACGGSIAYELALNNVKVALFDSGEVGREASWASAGMIGPDSSPELDPWFSESTKASAKRYGTLIEELRELTGRNIGYGGDGGLLISRTEKELESIRSKKKQQENSGIEIHLIDGEEACKREPALPEDVTGALFNPGGRQLDARAYTAAIVTGAQLLGAKIFPGQAVTGLQWTGNQVVGVETTSGPVRADLVVNAAGAWAGRIDNRLTHPVFPVHGQIMSIEGPPSGLKHNVSRASGYGYATPRPDGRIIVGATHEDFGFAKRITPNGLASLSQIIDSVLPSIASQPVLDIWSGLRPGTLDSLPTIGPDPRTDGGFLWATGHYSSGMMQMPATAMAVNALALGHKPPISIEQLSVNRYLNDHNPNPSEQFQTIDT